MARRKKKKLKGAFKLLFVLIGAFVLLNYLHTYEVTENKKLLEKKQKDQNYQQCLNDREIPEEIVNNLKALENSLNEYIAKYNVGFKYEELNYDYSLSYDSDKVFYGASLIKLVDAIYLLDNDIDLSLTKKYESSYKRAFSSKMDKRTVGENVSLKDLMEYAISVSDNTAHLMLIDYIGFDKLQNYGKSLGGKVILQGGDKFGNQTADDTMIYLNKAYELINNHKNGELLKNAMLNTEDNHLNFDNIVFGHKYGSYASYYHDIGIYFANEPYLISVLTTHDSNRSIVTNISKKVYEIHNKIVEEKEIYCYNLAYN
ncbi:MAG: serine hydrolase [Bacilli bacterium]|nr:serine hydrolase [Bacilli bacterium]